MKITSLGVLLSLGSHALALTCHKRDEEPQVLDPQTFASLGSSRLRTRHGPFLVPGVHDAETMGMKSFEGALAFPCSDCVVTGIVGDLEFADGSAANANTGMWLHHTVLANLNQTDATCEGFGQFARIWASGNERTVLDFSNGGTRKAGIHIGKDDVIFHITELMNESALEREAYLVLEVEYLPASTPDFRPVTPIWLDVAGHCTNSSVNVPEEAVFELDMEWTVGYAGEILHEVGHVHDGGKKLDLSVNGEAVCENVARYGESEEYITHVGMFGDEEVDHEHEEGEEDHTHEEGEGEEGHTHEEGEGEEGHDHSSSEHVVHISSINRCEELGRFAAGDVFSLKAYYDMVAHTPMAGHHGGLEAVMGISIVYVLADNPEVEEAEEVEEEE